MIYVTGDCHGEFNRFNTRFFPDQREMTKDDFVIVLGDFGLWHPCKSESYWLKWLSNKPFTTLFVDGNHENFDRLYSDEFPVVDFHGGKAHKIADSVYHLMRGYVFTLQDKTFFAFGGASSHDIEDGILDEKDFPSRRAFIKTCAKMNDLNKKFRVNHMDWWEQELPSVKEINRSLISLKQYDNRVDFVITHCLPQDIASLISGGQYKSDRLTSYFLSISRKLQFDQWYCGHYHQDLRIFCKYNVLYRRIIRIV